MLTGKEPPHSGSFYWPQEKTLRGYEQTEDRGANVHSYCSLCTQIPQHMLTEHADSVSVNAHPHQAMDISRILMYREGLLMSSCCFGIQLSRQYTGRQMKRFWAAEKLVMYEKLWILHSLGFLSPWYTHSDNGKILMNMEDEIADGRDIFSNWF